MGSARLYEATAGPPACTVLPRDAGAECGTHRIPKNPSRARLVLRTLHVDTAWCVEVRDSSLVCTPRPRPPAPAPARQPGPRCPVVSELQMQGKSYAVYTAHSICAPTHCTTKHPQIEACKPYQQRWFQPTHQPPGMDLLVESHCTVGRHISQMLGDNITVGFLGCLHDRCVVRGFSTMLGCAYLLFFTIGSSC